MGCCIFVVMIIAQALEAARRVRGFFGAPVKTAGAAAPALIKALRAFSARPASRALMLILLSFEASAAASWIVIEHREHVRVAVGVVARWVGIQTQPLVVMCRGSRS